MLYRLTRAAAWADVIFLTGIVLVLQYGGEHLEVLTSSYDWMFRLLQAVGVLGAIGTIALIWNFVAGLGNVARPWWTKLTDLLVALSGIAFVWVVFALKLITVSLNY
jgi:hypothetical protein